MVSTCFLIMFVIVAVAACPPIIISATEFIVGDDKGWTFGFDYQAWAQRKEFHVGDNLVFKYPEGTHNIVKVNGTGFQQCVAPAAASTQALTTGNDVIVLSSPGRKWYICSIAKHCEAGNMKLAITVQESLTSSPSPSPCPISAATGSSPVYSAWIPSIFAVLTMTLG